MTTVLNTQPECFQLRSVVMAFLKLIAALMRFWLTPPLLDAPLFLSFSFEGFDSFLRISKFSRKKVYIKQWASNYNIKTFILISLTKMYDVNSDHQNKYFYTLWKLLWLVNMPMNWICHKISLITKRRKKEAIAVFLDTNFSVNCCTKLNERNIEALPASSG